VGAGGRNGFWRGDFGGEKLTWGVTSDNWDGGIFKRRREGRRQLGWGRGSMGEWNAVKRGKGKDAQLQRRCARVIGMAQRESQVLFGV